MPDHNLATPNYLLALDDMARSHDLSWLHSTKPSAETTVERTGVEVSVLDNYWVVQTDDPTKLRNPEVVFGFDISVAPGVRLTDPARIADLVIVKAILIHRLGWGGSFSESGGIVAKRRLTAGSAFELFQALVWITKWRLALGLESNSSLTPALFEEFCEQLSSGGYTAVVGLDQRVEALAAALEKGEASLPTYKSGTRACLSTDELAAMLGVTRPFLTQHARWPQYLEALLRASPVKVTSRSTHAPDLAGDATVEPPQEAVDAAALADTADRVGRGTARWLILAWRELHELSASTLPQTLTIGFDPLEGTSVEALVDRIAPAEETGRTRTLEPEMWLRLLDTAARWLLDYAQPLRDICALAEALPTEKHPRGQYNTRLAYDLRRAKIHNIIDEHWDTGNQGWPKLLPAFAANNAQPRPNGVSDGLFLNEALVCLYTAAIILIGGFSARRERELDSLQADCAEMDQFGEWWLKTYIEKTVRDMAYMPIPPLVGAAVKMLEEMSESGRRWSSTPWLKSIKRPKPDKADKYAASGAPDCLLTNKTTSRLLQVFARANRLTGNADGQNWVFAAHQLRRAFSLYFFYGYRYSSLDALSRFLYHFSPEMTRRYITEGIAGQLARLREITHAKAQIADEQAQARREEALQAAKDLEGVRAAHEEVRQGAFVGHVVEMHDGLDQPIGKGAATLYDALDEWVEAVTAKIRVSGRNGSPDEARQLLIDRIRAEAPTRFLEPIPGDAGHCGCAPGNEADLAKAQCLRGPGVPNNPTAQRPDYTYADLDRCLGCAHFVAFRDNISRIERAQAAVADAAKRGSSAPVRVTAMQKLEMLRAQVAQAKAATRGRGRA